MSIWEFDYLSDADLFRVIELLEELEELLGERVEQKEILDELLAEACKRESDFHKLSD